MSDNLTVDELNRAVNSVPKDSDIIGFKVHPSDLRYITEQLQISYIHDTRYALPYCGLSLYPDVSIPRGSTEPVRKQASTSHKEGS